LSIPILQPFSVPTTDVDGDNGQQNKLPSYLLWLYYLPLYFVGRYLFIMLMHRERNSVESTTSRQTGVHGPIFLWADPT